MLSASARLHWGLSVIPRKQEWRVRSRISREHADLRRSQPQGFLMLWSRPEPGLEAGVLAQASCCAGSPSPQAWPTLCPLPQVWCSAPPHLPRACPAPLPPQGQGQGGSSGAERGHTGTVRQRGRAGRAPCWARGCGEAPPPRAGDTNPSGSLRADGRGVLRAQPGAGERHPRRSAQIDGWTDGPRVPLRVEGGIGVRSPHRWLR